MPGQIWKTKSLKERHPELFGENPFTKDSKGWVKWNELNPSQAKAAEVAQTVGPLPGASPSFWSPEYGGIPATANPITSAANAVTGNVANLPAIQGMAGGINQFNIGEQQSQYNTALPGYSGMVGQSSANIGSRLRGELPQDVVRQITTQAAERGVALGLPGSPFSNSELIRTLGLTSLGLQTQGENELTQAIGRTPTVPLFNTASFLVSPQEQQGAQEQANLMAAAPVPAKAQQTALDIARAGINAGASSIPQPQFQSQPQQSNSYSLVSDILSRYQPGGSTSVDPYAKPAQTAYNAQAAQPSWVNAPPPTYNVNPPAAASWNFGYELPQGFGTNIPDFLAPPAQANLGFNYDELGLWPD